jgi:hypothetical protein
MIDKTDFLVSEITNYVELNDETASIIVNTLYHVLATVPNRNSLDDLEACEKTYIGTAIEKNWLNTFGLPNKYTKNKIKQLKKKGIEYVNPNLDTVIGDVDVDVKHTIGNNFMIPKECIDQHCLLVKTNFNKWNFSLGVVLAADDIMTKGKNQDSKRSLQCSNPNIKWIVNDHPLEI